MTEYEQTVLTEDDIQVDITVTYKGKKNNGNLALLKTYLDDNSEKAIRKISVFIENWVRKIYTDFNVEKKN